MRSHIPRTLEILKKAYESFLSLGAVLRAMPATSAATPSDPIRLRFRLRSEKSGSATCRQGGCTCTERPFREGTHLRACRVVVVAKKLAMAVQPAAVTLHLDRLSSARRCARRMTDVSRHDRDAAWARKQVGPYMSDVRAESREMPSRSAFTPSSPRLFEYRLCGKGAGGRAREVSDDGTRCQKNGIDNALECLQALVLGEATCQDARVLGIEAAAGQAATSAMRNV